MIEEGQLVFAGTVDDFDNYIVPDTLIVTLINAPAPEELKAIEGVIAVEELGGKNYRVRFADATDVTERIVETSVAREWRLTGIQVEKSSMDAIFAELSKK